MELFNSRSMRWAANVGCMVVMRNGNKMLVRKPKDHLGDISIDSKILLKWILEKQCVYWIQRAHDKDQ